MTDGNTSLIPADRQQQVIAAFASGHNPYISAAKAAGVVDGVFGRHNGNTGEFIIGDETLDVGTAAAFEMIDAKRCWLGFDSDNKPVRGPEVPLASGQALPPHAEIMGVKWIEQIVVPIVTLDGRRVIYSSKADKPFRPIWKLVNTYGQMMSRHRDLEGRFMVPVVEIGSEPFTIQVPETQSDGTVRRIKATKYKEAFKIVDWMTIREVDDLVAGDNNDGEDAIDRGAADVVEAVVEDAQYTVIEQPKAPPAPPAPPARAPNAMMRRPRAHA